VSKEIGEREFARHKKVIAAAASCIKREGIYLFKNMFYLSTFGKSLDLSLLSRSFSHHHPPPAPWLTEA
jgi:hypothetical protein